MGEPVLSEEAILQAIRQGSLPNETLKIATNMSLPEREEQLIDLGKDISTLEQRLITMKKSYSQLQRRIALDIAYVSPVRRLPVELLDVVFSIYTQDHKSGIILSISRRELPPLTLSHVCTRWRNVVLSKKSRWSTIHLDLDKEIKADESSDIDSAPTSTRCLVELYLKYSGPDHPLDIWIDGPSSLPRHFYHNMASYWRVLAPIRNAIHRWGRLKGEVTTLYLLGAIVRFPSRYRDNEFAGTQTTAMPLLTTLSIYGLDTSWRPGGHKLSYSQNGLQFDQAPALTNLLLDVTKSPQLKAFGIPWNQITNCLFMNTSFLQAQKYLGQMSNVCRLYFNHLEQDQGPDTPAVQLPLSLQHLMVDSQIPDSTFPFQLFVGQNICSLDIVSIHDEAWTVTSQDKILSFFDASRSSSNLRSLSLPRSRIVVQDLEVILRAVPSLTFLRLYLNDIHLKHDSMSEDDRDAAFSLFMEFLSYSPPGKMLLPCLSDLTLYYFRRSWSPRLLGMLRSRQSSTMYPHRCKPIQNVKLMYKFEHFEDEETLHLDGVTFERPDAEYICDVDAVLWDEIPWFMLCAMDNC